jgi:hypothetical protein
MTCSKPVACGDQKPTQYSYHPACLLFPQVGKEELQEMADDIKENGLQNPIVLCDNQILDGRNRYLACEIADVEPRFVEWDGAGSPVEWVVSENLVRRHLTSSQRAVIAHDLLPLLEEEARERQRDAGRLAKKLADHKTNGKASQVAARIAKTNSAYVEVVKSIGAKAPELLDRVRSGSITVPDAKKLAKLPDDQRQDVLARCNGHPLGSGDLHEILGEVRKERREKAAREFATQVPDDGNILVGDMGILWDQLKDEEADAILTDPPYDKNAVESYERLAELAAAKLKPGGLCLAYSGQYYLPEVFAVMAKHLDYWWALAIRFSGSHCAIHPRHVQSKWRSIVVFAKPPLQPAPQWLSDHLEGGGRDWGQDQSEVEYLIEKLTSPGELVVDPFCGGGSVPAAAKKLGRRWIATEIDEATALIARKRLSEVTVGQAPENEEVGEWTF